jgi:glycosyl transferase family 25
MNGFVINMDSDHERLKKFQEQFQTTQNTIKIERFAAIDGKKYRTQPTSNDMSFYVRHFATDKTIGCFKSHYMLWQKIVDRGLPYAVIFEDDVFPVHPQNWENEIQHEIDKMSDTPWDIILLGYHSQFVTNHSDKYLFLFSFLQFLGYARQSHVVKDGIISPVTFAGTHAYVISQQGAQKLLNECSIIKKTSVDLRLAALHEQKKIILVACVNPIINTYGADENRYVSWIMNEGIFTICNHEIKHYHFVAVLLIAFALWWFTGRTYFLFTAFFVLFLFLNLHYADK